MSFQKVNKVTSVVVYWPLTWAFYPHQDLCTFHISSELWLEATNLCLCNWNDTILGKASKLLFLKPSLFWNPLNAKWPTFATFALPTFHYILWKMELPVQQLCKPEWSDKIGSGGYFVQLNGIAWPVETGFLVKKNKIKEQLISSVLLLLACSVFCNLLQGRFWFMLSVSQLMHSTRFSHEMKLINIQPLHWTTTDTVPLLFVSLGI